MQLANPSFDVFYGDLSRALCTGKHLLLCTKNLVLNIPALYQHIQEQQVDCAEFVPSVIRNLMLYLKQHDKSLSTFKRLIVGSEQWQVSEYQALATLLPANARLINSYGTSETSIDSCFFEGNCKQLSPSAIVPIGKPFNNSQIYLLDPHGHLVPKNVIGEIVISGDGVSQGYINNKASNQQQFINHTLTKDLEKLIYKTGDLGKWDNNGDLHILTRIDKQIKIRGHRVELGEIEAALAKIPNVISTWVKVEKIANHNQVIAYYQSENILELPSDIVQTHLTNTLPTHMIPDHIIALTQFPQLSRIKKMAMPQVIQAAFANQIYLSLPTSQTFCIDFELD